MAGFNADFWEVPTDSRILDSVAAERAMWFETHEDRERRHAFHDFFGEVSPTVRGMLETELTKRQREVVTLYYLHDKTQEDIASILEVSQSTVSRHLFGTTRGGKKVGGAISKLKKSLRKRPRLEITHALDQLESRLAAAV